ncbi:MAG: aminotransferase class III-fold pyridoxal phosphate-dependent enzyme, partial [Alicyclobacillaceae bacterium]|nr:aminotransferase class III-fold pyridoxal phosphate-dependent enzyme [Alicyclobacillaceae bacterium]
YLPLSATAVRADLFEAFTGEDPYAHFRHVNTFGGNATACALAVRTLELMDERDLIGRAEALGHRLRELLEPLATHPNVGDVRYFGFMAGIELVTDKSSKTPAPGDFVGRVIAGCKRRGVLIGKNSDTVPQFNNVLTISPPLVVSDEEVALIARVVTEALQEAAEAAATE